MTVSGRSIRLATEKERVDRRVKENKLLSNIIWLLFDKMLLMALNLVIIIVVANHYGAAQFGVFQYATNIVFILEVIVQLMDGRVIKKLYGDDDPEKIVFNVTLGKLFLGGVALLLGVAVSFFSTKGFEFKTMLLILLLDGIIKNLRFGMENRFEYSLQSKRVVIASNIGLSIGLAFQILAVYADWVIVTIALIQMLSSTISLLVLKTQYKAQFKPSNSKMHIDISLIRSIIQESLPLTIAAAAAVIYTRCDSVMLGAMLTTTEVGIYSISARLISAVQLLIVPIQTSIFVKMMDWFKTEQYDSKYIGITTVCTWISIVGVLFSFLALPYLFKILKPEYLPAMESFRILTIGSIFAYNAVLRSGHFTIIKNGNILMISQIVTVILNILLNYFFINLWGMNGAAIATSAAQGISLFVSNIFFKDARFVFKAQIMGFNPFNVRYLKHSA